MTWKSHVLLKPNNLNYWAVKLFKQLLWKLLAFKATNWYKTNHNQGFKKKGAPRVGAVIKKVLVSNEGLGHNYTICLFDPLNTKKEQRVPNFAQKYIEKLQFISNIYNITINQSIKQMNCFQIFSILRFLPFHISNNNIQRGSLTMFFSKF